MYKFFLFIDLHLQMPLPAMRNVSRELSQGTKLIVYDLNPLISKNTMFIVIKICEYY